MLKEYSVAVVLEIGTKCPLIDRGMTTDQTRLGTFRAVWPYTCQKTKVMIITKATFMSQ